MVYLFGGIIILMLIFVLYNQGKNPLRNLQSSQNNRTNKVSAVIGLSFVALLGVIFITLKPLINLGFIPISTTWSVEFKELITSIFLNLGQALFVGGLVGVIFETGSVKKYFEHRISDILINDEYLKHQENSELMRLRRRATKNIYAKKCMVVDPGLISLDEKICDALTEPYFDFFQESSICKLNDDNNYIVKNVRTRFKLINPRILPSNLLDVFSPKIRFKNIDGVNDEEIRIIKKFEIISDNSPITCILDKIEINSLREDSLNGEDGYKVSTEISFIDDQSKILEKALSFNEAFEVRIVEERKIPLNDLNYSFRMDTLVKNFKLSLVFENDKTELMGNLYGTMSNPREGIFIDKDSNSISIESKKWMLKGNGAYISIMPKDWSL